jgi:hypothetical protein
MYESRVRRIDEQAQSRKGFSARTPVSSRLLQYHLTGAAVPTMQVLRPRSPYLRLGEGKA